MKVSWRLTAEQTPSDESNVLVSYKNGEKAICYYDSDGDWVEAHSEIIKAEPLYWMCIPLLPYE